MEPEEIAVVLSRASELHGKLSLAIDRLVKLHPHPHPHSHSHSEELRYRNGSVSSSPSSRVLVPAESPLDGEAHSLASIRVAIEALEEQLQALQVLQQQQRAERDAGLAEIEESRRALLRRLKDHKGRELEVIQEALAFAGGTVPDKDELPLPPYPKHDEETLHTRRHSLESQYMGGSTRCLDLSEERSEVGEEGGVTVNESEEEDASVLDFPLQSVEERVHIGGGVRKLGVIEFAAHTIEFAAASFDFTINTVKDSTSLVGQWLNNIVGQPSKALLVAVGVLAALSIHQIGQKSRRKSVRIPAHRSHRHHHTYPHPLRSHQKGPCKDFNEEWMSDGDEFPKCIVQERTELPFYQELRTPDVMYGRG